MTVAVSLINMKGGVGKTTLTFNLAWFSAWQANLRVLAIDLDPQSNLSQYFMGAQKYLEYLNSDKLTVVDIFEQFSAPKQTKGAPSALEPKEVIHRLHRWNDGSLLDLIPSRLELAWTLKNPTEKAHLLPQFLSQVSDNYDLILIDCAPTESILTNAAYRSSRYVVVPVKPEFLATIGLPLLGRSLQEFSLMHQNQSLEMAGIIFNDARRSNPPPEQKSSKSDVKKLAKQLGWAVFDEVAHHSDSYPTGSRQGTPIFLTDYAHHYVKDEFNEVGNRFLEVIGLK
ncbi:ParA family protein [Escherichia coli]|jgi:chromosome partitioning protein|uniref:ParA family protein n=2 Tax=Enterobacter cloacae TaxID=550 RepID=A0A4Q2DYU8_ENTCL|nr:MULTISPECIES: ParA family protein [Klebsiella]EFO4427018.1 ParA family protein [Escherichia coli]RXW25900.1 ParA family protein [Enterobacter cloacae]CNC59727.1 plasmid partition protein [Yersinia frederiksenii]VVL03172.1 Sporulation initiation inhibitor protein soj [Klebsiella variicola]HBM3078957.1 ParA family protein [Klebsiella oxytoca]